MSEEPKVRLFKVEDGTTFCLIDRSSEFPENHKGYLVSYSPFKRDKFNPHGWGVTNFVLIEGKEKVAEQLASCLNSNDEFELAMPEVLEDDDIFYHVDRLIPKLESQYQYTQIINNKLVIEKKLEKLSINPYDDSDVIKK